MTARDMGAGLSVMAVAKHALASGAWEVVLAAQPPILQHMHQEGLEVVSFPASSVETPEDSGVALLLQAASDVIHDYEPTAVLAGLSGPGAGIDEAILAKALSCRSYALQDYWGDVNLSLGRPAGTYFVLDDEAARLTRKRVQARTVVAGSPKHAAYGSLNTKELRKKRRAGLKLKETRTLVSFFGQPLWEEPGYEKTLDGLATALSRSKAEALVLYRPHPKESSDQSARGLSRFHARNLEARLDDGTDLEATLAASDLVTACFSTCGYDHLMLGRISDFPLAPVLFLFFDPDIKRWYGEKSGLETLPFVTRGWALGADNAEEIDDLLARAFSESERDRLWRKLRQELPDPTDSPRIVLETIAADQEKQSWI